MNQSIIDLFIQYANNLFGLFKFCSQKELLLNLLFNAHVLEKTCKCPSCERESSVLHNSQSSYFGLIRFCPICNTHFSFYHNSIFTRSHIDPPTFMALAYCWVNQYSLENTCAECSVNKNTVTNYFITFRDSVIEELTSGPQEVIGGPQLNVEIDETVISHRKYNRGRILATVWVFGGICRETQKAFALVVPDRKAPTLNQEISDHIAPGSIIHSDSWAAYERIEQIPNRNYTHLSVNHSENFINPNNGSHTQNVERMWRSLKFRKVMQCGIRSEEASGYVFEYVWRRNNLKELSRGQKLIRLLQTIGQTNYT